MGASIAVHIKVARHDDLLPVFGGDGLAPDLGTYIGGGIHSRLWVFTWSIYTSNKKGIQHTRFAEVMSC